MHGMAWILGHRVRVHLDRSHIQSRIQTQKRFLHFEFFSRRRATSGQHRLKHEVTAKPSSVAVIVSRKDANAQRIYLPQSRKNVSIQPIKHAFRSREELGMHTLCSLDEFTSIKLECIFAWAELSHVRIDHIIATCIENDLVNGVNIAKLLQQR